MLVSSREEHGIRLIGPPRKDASWQNRTEGAYRAEHFAIDWEGKQVRCPQGKSSAGWKEYTDPDRESLRVGPVPGLGLPGVPGAVSTAPER